MNTRLAQIIANICLLATALLAEMPSSAKSLEARALKETARNFCVGKIAILPLQSRKKVQSRFTIVYFQEDFVPCTNEERNSIINDESAVDLERKMIAPLTSWIVAKTGWTIREAPPIRFIPSEQLVKMFTGEKPTDLQIKALYSDEDHSIYLPDGWRAEDLLDRSALLHELVHYLQYLNHIKAKCPAEYEWKAYELQVAWLREQGVEDPLKLMGISAVAIYVFSRCPEF